MGQVHSKRNVSQNQCPNIRDYDIIYGSTQMCAYFDLDWVGNMDDHKFASSYIFYWEMVLSIGTTRSKTLLLCYQ